MGVAGDVLAQPELLRHALSFAGRQYLYVAGVSTVWRQAWLANAAAAANGPSGGGGSFCTSHLCAITSVSCMEWAMDRDSGGGSSSRRRNCRSDSFGIVDKGSNAAGGDGGNAANGSGVTMESGYDGNDGGSGGGGRYGGEGDGILVWDAKLVEALAAAPDGTAVLKWGLDNGVLSPDHEPVGDRGGRLCDWAAGAGRLKTLQWAREHNFTWVAWTAADAARKGHLEVLQWLKQNGCPWNATTCSYAGMDRCLKLRSVFRASISSLLLRRRRPPGRASLGAGQRLPLGRQHNRKRRAPRPLGGAQVGPRCRMRHGHVHVPKGGRRRTSRRAEVGARTGRSMGREDVRQAKRGNLEMLQWCRANGCPWSEETCSKAASRGHLQVLQWCRDNGCPWDGMTCSWAAWRGHLEVLQWARANGCPWDARTCRSAAGGGHAEVLEWVHNNGCPCRHNVIQALQLQQIDVEV
ncbi:unnamed protein product [Phaeothamnion confervicola]